MDKKDLKMRKSGSLTRLVPAVLAVVLAWGSVLFTAQDGGAFSLFSGGTDLDPGQEKAAPPPKAVPKTQGDLTLSFAPVVKKVTPAVVNIYAARLVRNGVPSPLLNDPFFRHFFGEMGPFSGPEGRVQSALGSGVIVRGDGVVITNLHVVKNAEAIKVVLSDGQEFDGDIIARDGRTDLAAIRIKSSRKDFPFLFLRDADELEVGDIVLAIGNPFGFGQTVTSGIVSGLARSELGVRDFRSLIQTDAAVNPGNSGGPLVTLDGRVVGINTAIFSNTGGSIGLGFAIPSNLVMPVLASVDKGGRIFRPWMGIGTGSLTSHLDDHMGVSAPKGVLIAKVFSGTPAARAGLKPGDIIVDIDGHPIANESAYRFRMAAAGPGDVKKVAVLRDGTRHVIAVKLETPPDVPMNQPMELTGRNPLSGSVVVTLSPAVATELGLAYDEAGGVVIVQIRSGSIAAFSGLMPGDVIAKLNGSTLSSTQEMAKKLSRTRSGWQMSVRRGGETFVLNW